MSQIRKGASDITRYVMLVDSAAGTPETGYTITNLDLTYVRNRAAAVKADATALAAVDSVHGDNKAFQVDATNCPGLYRIDWPDAAFVTGVDKVLLIVNGSGLHPAVEEVDLVDHLGTDGKALVSTDAQDLSATLDVNAKTVTNGAISADTLAADTIAAAKIATGALTADAFAADAIVAATLATGAITADAVAANAIDASALAADAAAEIADAVWDELQVEHSTAGSFSLYVVNGNACEAACEAALVAYDPPTKAEVDTACGAVVLASDGLDSVSTTAPAGVASNFREMLVQVWRRLFKKATLTATQLKTYADNGTDVLTTQTVSDDDTTQTQGAAS